MAELNYHHLLVFRAVARAGSFTRAADHLAISQPSVSQQVRAFERALGLRLTERQGRGFRLTDAGERVAAHAERVADITGQLEAELAALKGGLVGQLVIAASTTTGEYFLPAVLGAFRRRYPGVTVRVDIANSARVQERILAGDVDLGLVGEPLDHPGLTVRTVASDEIVLVASPQHRLAGRPVSPEALAQEGYVAREPGSATRAIAEHVLAAAGVLPRVEIELSSNDAVKRAAAAMLGYAALSRMAVAPEVAAGWLVVLDAPWFRCHRPLAVIHAAGRHLGTPGRALVDLLASFRTPVDAPSH